MKVTGSLEFEIKDKQGDYVVSEMPVTQGLRNPYGVANAGAILWFADVTASVLLMETSKTQEGMKGFPLAISLNANLTGNQTEGFFTARAEFVKKGKTISVVRTTVTGQNNKLIADVTTSHVLSK